MTKIRSNTKEIKQQENEEQSLRYISEVQNRCKSLINSSEIREDYINFISNKSITSNIMWVNNTQNW